MPVWLKTVPHSHLALEATICLFTLKSITLNSSNPAKTIAHRKFKFVLLFYILNAPFLTCQMMVFYSV